MRHLIFFLGLILFHTPLATCQGVYEILNDYHKEVVSKGSFDSIKSYHQSINLQSNGQEYFIEKYFSRPFKFKDITLDYNRDTLSYYCFDGENLKSNRQEFLSLASNPYLKIINEKRFGLLNRVFYFSNLSLLKEVDQMSKNILYNVLKTQKDGIEFFFYFDKKTKLLLWEEDWHDGNLINKHEFLDYQKFGTIYYPALVRSTTANFTLMERTEKIEFNHKYEDSFFEGLK
jgi:hypothetical protein